MTCRGRATRSRAWVACRLMPIRSFMILLAVALATSPALGAPVIFTDRNVFDRVIGQHELVTFEEFPIGPVCLPDNAFTSDPCRLTIDGVTFSASRGFPEMNQRPQLRIESGLGAPLSKGLFSSIIPTAPGDFALSFNSHVLGLDVVTAATLGAPVTLDFTQADGTHTEYTIFAVINGGAFFGVKSDVGFSSLSLYAPSVDGVRYNFLIDNVALEPVPEPTTLLLWSTTMAGFGLAWRKQRRK
jgi:hypothetical protein